MDSCDPGAGESVPVKLQLRVLRYELERLEEDLRRLSDRHAEVQQDIARYEGHLERTRRLGLLRRVK